MSFGRKWWVCPFSNLKMMTEGFHLCQYLKTDRMIGWVPRGAFSGLPKQHHQHAVIRVIAQRVFNWNAAPLGFLSFKYHCIHFSFPSETWISEIQYGNKDSQRDVFLESEQMITVSPCGKISQGLPEAGHLGDKTQYKWKHSGHGEQRQVSF